MYVFELSLENDSGANNINTQYKQGVAQESCSILLIDDSDGASGLVSQLESVGCRVINVQSELDGMYQLLQHERPQLIFLSGEFNDSNGSNSLSFLEKLRAVLTIPIVFVIRGEQVSLGLQAMKMGANDLLVTPADKWELQIRILLQLTAQEFYSSAVRSGSKELRLQKSNRCVCYQNAVVELTKTEFDILAELISCAGELVPKSRLSKQTLRRELQPYDRSLDMHISNIRKKIMRMGCNNIIRTVRGSGYVYIGK